MYPIIGKLSALTSASTDSGGHSLPIFFFSIVSSVKMYDILSVLFEYSDLSRDVCGLCVYMY